jgi:molybdate transport system permease protein
MTPEEWSALRLSMVVSTVATLGSLPFAVIIGTWLARWRSPWRVAVEAVVMAPLVLPPVVTGYGLLWLLGRNGPLGSVLHDVFGVTAALSTWGAALAAAVVAFPLFVRAIRLSTEAIDPGLVVAARTLGASPLRAWATISLPLALPGVLTGALLAFARSLGEFGATITFVGNAADTTRTLPLAVFRATQVPGMEGSALRLVVVSLVLALVALVASELVSRAVARRVGRS